MFSQKKRTKKSKNDKILKKSKLIDAINEIDKSSQLYYNNISSSNVLNNDENQIRDDEVNIAKHENYDNKTQCDDEDDDTNESYANHNSEIHRNDEYDIASHSSHSSHENGEYEQSDIRDIDNELIYQEQIRNDSSPEEIFTRIIDLFGNILHKATSSSSMNKNILNFLEQKVDMVKMKEAVEECSICSEKSKIVKTNCCNFQLCKRCFIKWVYENSSKNNCNYTCPHCRGNDHTSIDIRFFQLMKEIC